MSDYTLWRTRLPSTPYGVLPPLEPASDPYDTWDPLSAPSYSPHVTLTEAGERRDWLREPLKAEPLPTFRDDLAEGLEWAWERWYAFYLVFCLALAVGVLYTICRWVWRF